MITADKFFKYTHIKGKTKIMDLTQPLQLPIETLKVHLKRRLEQNDSLAGSFYPTTVVFPPISQLKEAILKDGRINLDHAQTDLLNNAIQVFYSLIESALCSPYVKDLISSKDVTYSLDLCRDLFIESFKTKGRTKLLPPIKIPSQEACAELMKKFITKLPWKYQNIVFTLKLSQQGSKFLFERLDERGNIERKIEVDKLEEAYWLAFDNIMDLQFFTEKFNQTFDASKYLQK